VAIAKLSNTIVLLDLIGRDIMHMMRNYHLAGTVGDISCYLFRRMLECKSGWRGIEFIEIRKFVQSSRICSKCGWYIYDLKPCGRISHCSACGFEIDRNLNAAINVLNIGLTKTGRGISEFTHVEIATCKGLNVKFIYLPLGW